MIRHCDGELPDVYEVTADSQTDLWQEVADLAAEHDKAGRYVQMGSYYVNNYGVWEAIVLVS